MEKKAEEVIVTTKVIRKKNEKVTSTQSSRVKNSSISISYSRS